MAEELDEFYYDGPAEVTEHRESYLFTAPAVVFRQVKTAYPAVNSTLVSYTPQPETVNNLATYNPSSPEMEALAQALHDVLDQRAAGRQAPLEVNQHTVSQEDSAKIRIHAPNSDAFIDLMTPEEPYRVMTLCETAVDLLKRSNCQVMINGQPGTVVPHPYLFRAPHIESAVPQYAWLAYLGSGSSEQSLLPSIIFTRTAELSDNLETTHGQGQGLGFWEHTSPLSGEPSIYLVSLGKASLEYQSNAPGDVEDVAEIVEGIEKLVASDEAKRLKTCPLPPPQSRRQAAREANAILSQSLPQEYLKRKRRALRFCKALLASYVIILPATTTTEVIGNDLSHFGTPSQIVRDLQSNLVYHLAHPDKILDVRTTVKVQKPAPKNK